jgi:hypothetical protein
MISEGLRTQSFWLYGVIIGLAIKGALETAVGHLMVPPDGSLRDAVPETVRLVVFLLTSIQFYLGSVWFFDKFHRSETTVSTATEEESVAEKTPNTKPRYAIDYLFGLFHFLIFFGWALSLDTHKGHLRIFPVLLVVILLYDGLWCWACRGLDTYYEIRKWALTNAGVIIAAVAFYCLTYLAIIVKQQLSNPSGFDFWGGDPYRHRVAEPIAMLPVLAIACVDIVGTITDKQIIADWVVRRFR